MIGTILLWVAMIVVLLAGVYYRLSQTDQRRESLRALASRLGFQFNADNDEGFAVGWGFLRTLARGPKRSAFNILQGNLQGHRVFVFDYHYQVKNGNKDEDREATFLMLIVDQALPELWIRHETVLARIAEALGFPDINFESAEFSRTFNVQSPDKRFAYDVCNPSMIEYLLANRDLEMEIQGPAILLSEEKLMSTEEIELNLRRLLEIRSRLPDYLFTKS